MMERRSFKNCPDILTAAELARLLDVSIRTVYMLLSEKKIIGIKVGRAYKIPKRNVIKYLHAF